MVAHFFTKPLDLRLVARLQLLEAPLQVLDDAEVLLGEQLAPKLPEFSLILSLRLLWNSLRLIRLLSSLRPRLIPRSGLLCIEGLMAA